MARASLHGDAQLAENLRGRWRAPAGGGDPAAAQSSWDQAGSSRLDPHRPEAEAIDPAVMD
jgi:hypothetical protein